MRKVEVSLSFLRGVSDIARQARRMGADYLVYTDEAKARAKNPDEKDINTPEQNLANSNVFYGKAEAYMYVAEKLENLLRFYGLHEEYLRNDF